MVHPDIYLKIIKKPHYIRQDSKTSFYKDTKYRKYFYTY